MQKEAAQADPVEIVQRGKALYEQQIQAQVEAGNLGKVLVIGAPALGRLGSRSPVKAA